MTASYDRFVIWLWTTFGLTTAALAIAGANQWDLYYSAYLIEYLILCTVSKGIAPEARHALTVVGILLLPAFLVIVTLRALYVLGILI